MPMLNKRIAVCLLCLCLLPIPAAAQRKSNAHPVSKTRTTPAKIPANVLLRITQLEDERSLNGQELLRLTFDENPAVRQRAALTIGRIGDAAGTATLINLLEKDSHAAVREMAAFALGEMEDVNATTALLNILQSEKKNLSLRLRAVEALGKILTVLPNMARLGDLRIDNINAAVIAQLPAVTVRPFPAQKSLTLASITSLLRIRRAASVAPLTALLSSPDADIRGDAANALFRLGHPIAEAVPALKKLLADKDWNARANAARALGQSHDASVIEPLKKLLGDPSREVQVHAIRALGALHQSPANDALLSHGEKLLEKLSPGLKTNSLRPVETGLLSEIAALLANNKELRGERVESFVKKAYEAIYLAPRNDKAATTEQTQHHDQAYYERVLSRVGKKPVAIIQTKRGNITLRLFADDAPMTVDSFIELAKRDYFNGIIFHRVVPNFVIQGGDPTGTGNGGPGYKIRCEINPHPYRRGALGMALSGKDTGGSQFFITHSPAPHLDGGYTVFGQVLSGMNVVDQIVRGDVIEKITVLENGRKP
jgi:cyclophilin family peptidyl-prolyl cis-trans isomerase/HEAT repeat protein